MQTNLADKFYGVLFGLAVGDALGFATEFLSRAQVRFAYPQGLTDYSQIHFYSYITQCFESGETERWQAGKWTDDTEMTLCILDSLLAHQQVDTLDIARRFHEWASNDGFGIGELIAKVVFDSDFLRHPQQVALQYWEDRKRYPAPNGGVMRTAPLGLWHYQDKTKVKANAIEVCRITHADPRCVASCVAVSLAIARLVQGETDMVALVNEMENEVAAWHPELPTYFSYIKGNSLDVFDLDQGTNENEPVTYGYTLKTLGAAFWVLLHATSFEEGVSAIIHEGGDADTNAAVAGALLGARFGFANIPENWVTGLRDKEALVTRIEQLLSTAKKES